MKTESKECPVIKKLQGKILVPCNIEQKTRLNPEDQEETYYQYNTLRLQIDTDTSLDNLKTVIKTELREQNDAYIYSKYKAGTQQSMQGIFADPETTEEAKNLIKTVWDWIRKTDVLPYYYSKKMEIENAADVEVLLTVVWDFSQFDTTNPDVKLSDLV